MTSSTEAETLRSVQAELASRNTKIAREPEISWPVRNATISSGGPGRVPVDETPVDNSQNVADADVAQQESSDVQQSLAAVDVHDASLQGRLLDSQAQRSKSLNSNMSTW
eukprot:5616297-Amphidinium_carterae.1